MTVDNRMIVGSLYGQVRVREEWERQGGQHVANMTQLIHDKNCEDQQSSLHNFKYFWTLTGYSCSVGVGFAGLHHFYGICKLPVILLDRRAD